MTARDTALALLLVIALLLIRLCIGVDDIVEQLEAAENEIQWCTWHHERHSTKLIKGGKSAEKFRREIGRPSDDGGC